MEAYIIAANRTAIAKAKKGGFKNYRSDDLAVDVIKAMMAQFPQIENKMVDDVIVGCANPEGEQGLQMGRQISLRALGETAPGFIINRYCASGLESIALAVAKIKAGMGHIIFAGGTESMTAIPMTGYKLAPNYGVAATTPDYVVSMGITAEAVAQKYEVTREQADEFAYNSHVKAAAAIDAGKFDDQIIPITVPDVNVINNKKVVSEHVVKMDEGVRRSTTVEALSKLRPVFQKGGVVTAGNSSQTSDGASFVIVVSEEMVKQLNLQPIARLVTYAVGGVDPLYMGIGPTVAIPKALKQAGMTLNQIDQIELNEAFATQSLAVIKDAGLNPDIVNVNGGAIALGHPLACTGAKLSTQLFSEMRLRKQKYGMVTACVGGGQGMAGIWELL